ncbi:MAG TPA: DUF4350 domain-containing protein [Gemmatimonadales bacterium]|nr:DUF4350 domain-containing protein [Gemmatimonadales bacterium]
MLRRLEIGLALLLTMAIGVAIWAARRTPQPPRLDSRRSTMLSGPYGSRAVYDVLVQLGRPVQRRRTSLFDFTAETREPALLVELHPPFELEPAELDEVAYYVEHGGAVLSAGDGGGITACAGWRLQPDGWADDSVDVVSPPGAPNLPQSARVLTRKRPAGVIGEKLSALAKESIESRTACDSLVAVRSETLLVSAKQRPVALRLWYKRGGSITLVADAGWFGNRVWRDTDIPVVALPWLASPSGRAGRVVVDEYHQGFRADEQSVWGVTWRWMRSSPMGWAILQVVAIALVWLAVSAVRFGPALAVIERRRRSPLEHLEALGAGLESAGATETAVERLVGGLRRRLSRTGSFHTSEKQMQSWLETLELAMRDPKGRAAVKRLRRLLNERNGGDAQVLAAAQTVEEVWEQLHPPTARARS